jgi:hypothetical protein
VRPNGRRGPMKRNTVGRRQPHALLRKVGIQLLAKIWPQHSTLGGIGWCADGGRAKRLDQLPSLRTAGHPMRYPAQAARYRCDAVRRPARQAVEAVVRPIALSRDRILTHIRQSNHVASAQEHRRIADSATALSRRRYSPRASDPRFPRPLGAKHDLIGWLWLCARRKLVEPF